MVTINPTKLLQPPPAEVFFHDEQFLPEAITPPHCHSWGQLQLIDVGVLEVRTPTLRLISPSQYAAWVPAHIEHETYMRRQIHYFSINIMSHVLAMPEQPCLIQVSPILRAIIEELQRRKLRVAKTDADKRLVEVILDQLCIAKQQQTFLPGSQDRLLLPILTELEHDPTNTLSLAAWAARAHTTERTLARRCQSSLGISFSEWRQRRKFLLSLDLLRQGLSIKQVALNLGYHQSSPFIILFKKYSGCTPTQYRQHLDQGR